ncbi:MAG: hypothetical protein HRT44_00495 [Bdellovibrionales bacterium]|nr:hypothetical protein [Bdellovibrionales bacterium]NQZ17731.1 hypothetical protein [Bdellovibrionales bacterium]
MFRSQWDEFENKVNSFVDEIKEKISDRQVSKAFKGVKQKVITPEEAEALKEDFIQWGKSYTDRLKSKVDHEKVSEIKSNFFTLLRNLGVNDQLLQETFASNKKEFLDPLVGESIAIIALILGWSKKDKELFSQSLGEIGVAGLFAAKPFILLIAICGLAYGYNRSFHKEAFKKGGVLGLAGLTAAWLAPGPFVGLLAAIVAMVYFNRKLSVDKPIEKQLKEIFNQIRGGEFFSEVRESWKSFEEFLAKLFIKTKEV